jgi:hypothetical protein
MVVGSESLSLLSSSVSPSEMWKLPDLSAVDKPLRVPVTGVSQRVIHQAHKYGSFPNKAQGQNSKTAPRPWGCVSLCPRMNPHST